MTITGGFDVVIQVTNQSLTAACARLHAKGFLSHRTSRSWGSELFDIVFGAPSVTAVPPQADGLTRLVARTRAVIRARPLNEPWSAGRSAVADMTFRPQFEPTVSAGRPLSADDTIPIDWSETTPSDIVVHTTDTGFETDVRTALLELMQDGTSSFISIGSLIAIGARGAVVCTISVRGGGASVGVGLDMGSGGGSATAIENQLQYDWSVGLRREYIIGRAVEALGASLGGALPPPYGSSSVMLADQHGRGRFLTRLDLDLVAGRLVVGGALAQRDGLEIAADWHADVTLAVDGAGVVRAQVGRPTIQLSGLLAGFASFLSGGSLEETVRQAVASGLETSFGGPGMAWLEGLIGRLGDSAAGARLRVVAIDVRADGIVLHGVVDAPAPRVPPIASLTLLSGAADPRRLLLAAAGSWTPGGDIAAIAWQPGDGTTITTSGDDCRLAVEHIYPSAGSYTTCLEVTDATGRLLRICQLGEVGVLRFQLVSATAVDGVSGWEVCGTPGETVTLDIVVTATGRRMPGVNVTVRGGGWRQAATTGRDGIARISVDVDRVQHSPATGGAPPPMFNLGGVDVDVGATGWVGSSRRVWLIDCAARAVLREQALRARDQWVERLAGYAELSRIREELGRAPRLPDMEPGTPPWSAVGLNNPFPARDPRLAEAAAIEAAQAVLHQVSTLLAMETGTPFAHEILSAGRKVSAEGTIKRLDTLWAELDRAASHFEQSYGEPRDPKRPW